MSTFMPRITDAELAAQWSSQALNEGRYDLGLALARIAVQAARSEAQPTPAAFVPQPDGRHLYPVPTAGRAPVPTEDDPADALTRLGIGITAPAERDFQHVLSRALQEDIERLPVVPSGETRPGPMESRRCEAKFVRDGIADVCHGVLFWAAQAQSWHHVDASYDRHHDPVVPAVELP